MIALSCLINDTSPCFALEKGKVPTSFTIQQEKLYQNGVWISHPKPNDEKISALLRANNIQTLEDYTQWLTTNTFYQKDKVDSWASPEETFRKGYGDCED